MDQYKNEETIAHEIVSVIRSIGFKDAYESGLGHNAIGIMIECKEYEFSLDIQNNIILRNIEGTNYKTFQPIIRKVNKNIGKIGTVEFVENLKDELKQTT